MKLSKRPWQIQLADLIEKEIVCATGIKSKTHFSGKCYMNDILIFVEKLLKTAKKEK